MRFRCVSAVVIAFALFFAAHSAGAQNLLPDPTFSAEVSAWRTDSSLGPLVPMVLERQSSAGSDGAAGFARLTSVNGGPGSFAASVCVPVDAGRAYSWGGYLRFVAPPIAVVSFRVVFREAVGCNGQVVPPHTSTLALYGSDVNTWQFFPGADVVAPPGALSATFEVYMGCGPCGPFSVDFDNVYFGPRGTGPPAAVAVPTMSEAAICVFAFLLALAGAWRVAKA